MTDRAVDLALDALRHRDLSEQELDRKLAARGVAEGDRASAVETLRRTGLLDELRFARGRAATLASRGAGNAFVRDALRRAGVSTEIVEAAIEELASEAERAGVIVASRGTSARTARYLAGKGFAPDTVAAVLGHDGRGELG
jgi:SOS response regulatory protein OraA/RecX